MSGFHPMSSIPGGSALPSKIKLRSRHILIGALNSGYGFRSRHPGKGTFMTWSGNTTQEIFNFTLSKINGILSNLVNTTTTTTSINNSYSELESTEKAVVSFTLGCAITYLTAKEWIKAHNDSLALLIHERYFNNLLTPKLQEKHPDYIAITTNGNFHVFESKGGNDLNTAVANGMLQLANAENFFRTNSANVTCSLTSTTIGTHLVKPISYVCVHTKVDAGSDIEINAYDPPGQYDAQTVEGSYTLDLDHLLLLKLQDAINIFESLTSKKPQATSKDGWQIIQCPLLENINIAIRKKTLNHNDKIKQLLSILDATKDIPIEQKNSINYTIAIIKNLANQYAKETKFQSKIEQDIIENFLNEYWIVRWYWDDAHDKNPGQFSFSDILRHRIDDVLGEVFSETPPPAFENTTENDYILDVRGLTPAGESNEKEPVWQQLRSKFRHISNNGI